MIIWKCEVCGKTCEAYAGADWYMKRHILEVETDLCDKCAKDLMSWLNGKSIIVPMPLNEQRRHERCRLTESH